MKKVFVPQEPRVKDPSTGSFRPQFDISPALKFGTIEVLLPSGPMLLDTTETIDRLKEQLADFNDDDSILCIGDPSAIAAAVMVASFMNDGFVAILQYSRQHREYNRIILEL